MGEIEQSDHVTWSAMLGRVVEATGDRAIAKWLCEHASGCEPGGFATVMNEFVTQRAGLHLESMLRRYLGGEPLQYAMGRWAFRRLDLMVDRRVLIPRPETEHLVDLVIDHLRVVSSSRAGAAAVADLGTGSGAIGLALLDETARESTIVWMTDASEDALDVARANATGLGVKAAGARFARGDWFAALPAELRGRLDAVVTNPPYIAEDDPEVDRSVREWEPSTALFSGGGGLDAVRRIVSEVGQWLTPGGLFAAEIGRTQGPAVLALMVDAGLVNAAVTADPAGHDRYATAFAPR